MVLLFTSTISADSLDLNSYCKGKCQVRYQDGMYLHDRCACIDYFSVDTTYKLGVPTRPPGHSMGPAYDGSGFEAHSHDD